MVFALIKHVKLNKELPCLYLKILSSAYFYSIYVILSFYVLFRSHVQVSVLVQTGVSFVVCITRFVSYQHHAHA